MDFSFITKTNWSHICCFQLWTNAQLLVVQTLSTGFFLTYQTETVRIEPGCQSLRGIRPCSNCTSTRRLLQTRLDPTYQRILIGRSWTPWTKLFLLQSQTKGFRDIMATSKENPACHPVVLPFATVAVVSMKFHWGYKTLLIGLAPALSNCSPVSASFIRAHLSPINISLLHAAFVYD